MQRLHHIIWKAGLLQTHEVADQLGLKLDAALALLQKAQEAGLVTRHDKYWHLTGAGEHRMQQSNQNVPLPPSAALMRRRDLVPAEAENSKRQRRNSYRR